MVLSLELYSPLQSEHECTLMRSTMHSFSTPCEENVLLGSFASVSHNLLTSRLQHSHWLFLSLETCSLRLCIHVSQNDHCVITTAIWVELWNIDLHVLKKFILFNKAIFAKCMEKMFCKQCLTSPVPCKMTVYRILITFKMICSLIDERKIFKLLLFSYEAWFIVSASVSSKNIRYWYCEHHHAVYEVCLYDLEIGV
jgi:hypothetical protein